MTIKLTLFSFWQDKEKEWGRRITILEVSKTTGVNRATIAAYLNDKIDRPDLRALDKLCQYFNVPAGPVSFIVYDPD